MQLHYILYFAQETEYDDMYHIFEFSRNLFSHLFEKFGDNELKTFEWIKTRILLVLCHFYFDINSNDYSAIHTL